MPHFPNVTRRLLHGDTSIPATYVVFDALGVDGHDLRRSPHHARREVLESLALNDGHCITADTFDDGQALYQGGVRARAGGNRRETLRQHVPAGAARLDQGEEPPLLAA